MRAECEKRGLTLHTVRVIYTFFICSLHAHSLWFDVHRAGRLVCNVHAPCSAAFLHLARIRHMER